MNDDALRRRAKPRIAILDDAGEAVLADRRGRDDLAPFVEAARSMIRRGESIADVVHRGTRFAVRVAPLQSEATALRYALVIEARGFRRPLIDAMDRFLLTPRELEVLALIVEGASNREIAQTLHIVPGTVQDHVRNLCRKTGAQRRGSLLARVFGVAGSDAGHVS